MKKVYKIGTKQEFTYKPFLSFKKSAKLKEHWVVRNVKYIYANNEEEASNKYEEWFFRNYPSVIEGWGNWYLWSNDVNIAMNKNRIDITSTSIVAINAEKDINVNLETLKENMQAENFREWWFDGSIKL